MLQFIRDRAKGWIAWGIVGLISIPFAVWGVHNYLSTDPDTAVATVNGSDIGLQFYEQTLRRQRQQLRAMLGDSLDPAMLDDERIREGTLDKLVRDEVLLQAGSDSGMRVSDAQLALAVRTQQAFQDNGMFAQGRYESWLRQQGYSPGGFEFDFRRALLLEQLDNGVRWSALATDAERARTARLSGQKRRFRQMVVPASKFRQSGVSAEDVEAYYASHRDLYIQPERVRVAYVEVSRSAIATEVDVPEEELHQLYESQKLNFMRAERREASHILVTVAADAPAEEVEAATARLEAARSRLDAGENFEDVAREVSEDPGSAATGGGLGFFERGIMDPAFENAVFSMSVGEVSEPVRTRFGLHLIKLTGIDAPAAKPFEEVRGALLAEARDRDAEQIFFERVERLANLAFEHPESLEPAAEALGIEVREAAPFDRAGDAAEGIATESKVRDAAFNPDVLTEGNNSEPVELEGGRVVVLRVLEHEDSRTLALDTVRERVVEALERERAAEAALEAGEAAVQRLRAGEDADAVAASLDLAWEETREVGRDEDGVAPEVLGGLYRIRRPAGDGTPVYDGVRTAAGSFVVLSLEAVEDGAPEGADPRLPEAIASQHGAAAADAVTEALRERAKVKLRRDRLG